MEKKIHKTVQICDICERENNYLQKCIVCGKEYCLTCQSVIPGCMIGVDCCKECTERDDVNEIVKKYAIPLFDTKKLRDEELKKLNIKG